MNQDRSTQRVHTYTGKGFQQNVINNINSDRNIAHDPQLIALQHHQGRTEKQRYAANMNPLINGIVMILTVKQQLRLKVQVFCSLRLFCGFGFRSHFQ